MGASKLVSVVVSTLLAGCVSQVQPGLANAPALGKATAEGGASHETRVHDVIANGRDSCERSAFPQGEVLRGHIPPCVQRERIRTVAPPSPPPPPREAWLSPSYPSAVCGSPMHPRGPGIEGSAPAFWLSPPDDLMCNEP